MNIIEYFETGRYTNDGVTFHTVGKNLRVGKKRYCNVQPEQYLSLGFFPEYEAAVYESDYNQAELDYGIDNEEFPYRSQWSEYNGQKVWLTFITVLDPIQEPEEPTELPYVESGDEFIDAEPLENEQP